MSQKYDYLIVGQGLAGSTLAYELLQNGVSINIIDNPIGQSSSKVAAGIFNPITGKRFVKTWLCDEIFDYFIPFYHSIEKRFSQKIIHQMPIVRPVESIQEQNFVISLADESENEPYVKFQRTNIEIDQITTAKLGYLETKISGWVDIPIFLEVLQNFFKNLGVYKSQVFDYKQLVVEKDGVIYQDKFFKKIIFCEGYGAVENPFFSWLPFNAVKGELINVEMEAQLQNQILMKGIFVLPISGNKYKVGATYNWQDKSPQITDDARNTLKEKLTNLVNTGFEITNQFAGIRPATIDRRPFLGMHPSFENVGIFNGLGTKGVSLAPYFAHKFVDFLINNVQLQPDININRFSSLYLSSDFTY